MSPKVRAIVLATLLCAVAAQADEVFGQKTLWGLVTDADLVIDARIVAPGEPVSVTTGAGTAGRPAAEAEVIDVLKGSYDGKRVRFAQHGHGGAQLQTGARILLFLVRLEPSRELAGPGEAGTLSWVSLQEHDDAYPLEQATRRRLLRAVRAYVAAETAPTPQARDAALRRASRDLINSGDTRLAASAVGDLMGSNEQTAVSPEDLPALIAVIRDPATAMGVRTGLLAELGRRELVDATPLWLELLSDDVAKPDLIVALRAAGASGGPSVRPRLREALKSKDTWIAATAARALGEQRDAESIPALAEAIASNVNVVGNERRIRNAAIRALGQIGTPEALAVLEQTHNSNPDYWTRIRAGRERRDVLTDQARARAQAEAQAQAQAQADALAEAEARARAQKPD